MSMLGTYECNICGEIHDGVFCPRILAVAIRIDDKWEIEYTEKDGSVIYHTCDDVHEFMMKNEIVVGAKCFMLRNGDLIMVRPK